MLTAADAGQSVDPAMLKSACTLVVLLALLLWESWAPCLGFFVGHGRARLVHGARNFTLGLINAAFTAAALATLWTAVTAWAQRHQFGLLNWLGLQGPWRWAIMVLAFDAWMYWWHRCNHLLPWLWRFHRVHHSDPCMDVTTAQRFHLGEILLSALLRTPVLALLGMTLFELAIYETFMFTVVQLHHANVALPSKIEQVARLLIVTPALHKVHHSRIQAETDSNYASLFAWWDLLFASRRERANLQAISFGLDGFDGAQHQSLRGLAATPTLAVENRPNPRL